MKIFLNILITLGAFLCFLIASIFVASLIIDLLNKFYIIPHFNLQKYSLAPSSFLLRDFLGSLFYIPAIYLTHLAYKRNLSKVLVTGSLLCANLVIIIPIGVVLLLITYPVLYLSIYTATLPSYCTYIHQLNTQVGNVLTLLSPNKAHTICDFAQDPSKSYYLDSATTLVDPDSTPTATESARFKSWANIHGINLQGTSRNIDLLYKQNYGFNPETDALPLSAIPGSYTVYLALKDLPENLLGTLQGKTIYISTVYLNSIDGPGEVLPLDPSQDQKGLHPGIILGPPFSFLTTVHEFGHVVADYGIQGYYGADFPQLRSLQSDFQILFDTTGTPPIPLDKLSSSTPPTGYISTYATTNIQEDFAESFAYYVEEGSFFRNKMQGDPLLTQKYNFLKDKIFNSKEY